ncbi:MAG: TIR domain-containing protein [Gammaproteobacteria bacterium]
MPSLFLSYARADLKPVLTIERGLRAAQVSVWRDQDKLYGGQRWPKALGEAIAAQDYLLLCWSKSAAASTYVELEWCTALALKKTIIPCLLDDAPLPPSLRSIQGIRLDTPAQCIPSILAALQERPVATDPARSAEVIGGLAQITAMEPNEVLKTVKATFEQHHWTVQGNVYQAAGDIIITPAPTTAPEAKKPLLEKWQTWLALAIAVLTVVTMVLELPSKIGILFPAGTSPENKVLEQTLAGSVPDELGAPLAEVQVALPELRLKTTTDQLGEFSFRVKDRKQCELRLLAQKPGFETYEAYATLGNTQLGFAMRRKP